MSLRSFITLRCLLLGKRNSSRTMGITDLLSLPLPALPPMVADAVSSLAKSKAQQFQAAALPQAGQVNASSEQLNGTLANKQLPFYSFSRTRVMCSSSLLLSLPCSLASSFKGQIHLVCAAEAPDQGSAFQLPFLLQTPDHLHWVHF